MDELYAEWIEKTGGSISYEAWRAIQEELAAAQVAVAQAVTMDVAE